MSFTLKLCGMGGLLLYISLSLYIGSFKMIFIIYGKNVLFVGCFAVFSCESMSL